MKFKLTLYLFIFILGALSPILVYLLVFKNISSDRIEISSTVILREIKNLKRLELAQFVYSDIIEYSIVRKSFGLDFLAPDSKSLLIVYGEAIAGVNLENLDSSSIKFYDDTIELILPQPEIFLVRIDHSKTKIIDLNLTARILNPDLSQKALAKSEDFIKNAAIANGILEKTKVNAEEFFSNFIKLLTKKNCKIYFEDNLRIQKNEN